MMSLGEFMATPGRSDKIELEQAVAGRSTEQTVLVPMSFESHDPSALTITVPTGLYKMESDSVPRPLTDKTQTASSQAGVPRGRSPLGVPRGCSPLVLVDDDSISEKEWRRLHRMRGGGSLSNAVGGTAMLGAILLAAFVIGCLSIACLIIYGIDGHNECVQPDPTIKVSWANFLLYHGVVDVAAIAIFLIILTIHICCRSRKDPEELEDTNACCGGVVGCLLFATLIFQFCWFIVGSILYFHDVGGFSPNCPRGSLMYDFGLAWFVIELGVWVMLIITKLY